MCSGLPLRHRVEVRILATFVGVLLALTPTGSLSGHGAMTFLVAERIPVSSAAA